MQDLFQTYVDDLNKLRSAFHEELAAEARELSNAMSKYSQCTEAALASFMDKVSARGVEFEVLAETRTQSVSRSSGKGQFAGCQ